MDTKPMQRARALDMSTPGVDELRAELDSIRAALDRLLSKADAAGIGEGRRLSRYLRQLDDLHDSVVQGLGDIEGETRDVEHVARDVREAWARLAIAKTAAEARIG